VIAATWFSSVDAAQVRLHLDKESFSLITVRVHGAEYLTLASLARAVGKPVEQVRAHRSYRIQLGSSSLLVTVNSSEVRVGKIVVPLSLPPRMLGGSAIVPLELLPIALSARYGEGRVNWDPVARVARIDETVYSLRALRFRTYPDHTRVVLEGTRAHDFVLCWR
jgi:hypothetical protein